MSCSGPSLARPLVDGLVCDIVVTDDSMVEIMSMLLKFVRDTIDVVKHDEKFSW